MSKILIRLTNIFKKENGASAVEFALVFSILLFLVFGIVQFGIIFNYYISITHAAREGARWAALERPESEVKSKVIAAAPTLNPPLDESNITVEPQERTIENQSQPTTVTVTYTLPIDFLFFMDLEDESITLKSSATQRIE